MLISFRDAKLVAINIPEKSMGLKVTFTFGFCHLSRGDLLVSLKQWSVAAKSLR